MFLAASLYDAWMTIDNAPHRISCAKTCKDSVKPGGVSKVRQTGEDVLKIRRGGSVQSLWRRAQEIK